MPARGWRRVFRLETGRRHVEHDVDAELAFHLEMRTQKLVAQGLDPDTARRRAIEQFGDYPSVLSECLTIGHDRERAMKLSDMLANLRQDVMYASRSLRKQPGFAVVVVLILALGIGANSATFTLIDALLLRTLPVPHPEQLITIGDPSATGTFTRGTPATDIISYPLFADVRDHVAGLSGMYATGSSGALDVETTAARGDAANASHPRGRLVSGNFFSVLQVPAFAGRTFTAAEDRPGAPPVAVISYAYWQRAFNGERSAIGRTISVNGTAVTVLGVTPRTFSGDIVGSATDIWMPIVTQPAIMPHREWLKDRRLSWLLLMGRLAPGATVDRARASITAIETQSILDHTEGDDDRQSQVASFKENPVKVALGARGFSYLRSAYGSALRVLMSAVVLVVLVVCANVANLMLARSAARSREISVRMTLGAGRLRLVQQLLTESLILAVAAAVLGLMLASWGSRLMLRVASTGPTPIPLDVHVDGRIMLYTAVVSLLTMLLFGLAPALRATHVELATALRTHGRSIAGFGSRPGRLGIGKLLVIAQVALSTLLLVGTGMLLHSMQRIGDTDLGFDRAHVVVASVGAQRSGYSAARLNTLIHDIAAAERRIPGVAAATYSGNGLFSGTESGTGIRVPGYEIRADSEKYVAFDAVGPGYLAAIGARLVRGREIDEHDIESSPKVTVLNETAARFYFGTSNPVGRTLTRDDSVYTVVGVARDVEEQSVRAVPVRRLYFSIHQVGAPPAVFNLEVRTIGDPAQLVQRIRQTALDVDATLRVNATTFNDLVHESTGQEVLVTRMISFFGLLTLVLAALGLYGVMAYATARRTNEFGIRLALGAEPRRVSRMIFREALLLTAGGVALGLPAGLLGARFIRGQTFGVGAVDPPSLGGAIVVLVATAVVASYLPARRAARVGPLEALRSE